MPGRVLIQFFFCPVVSACINNILTCKHDDFQFRCLIFRHAYHLLSQYLKFVNISPDIFLFLCFYIIIP